jgi:hypothetical protein
MPNVRMVKNELSKIAKSDDLHIARFARME